MESKMKSEVGESSSNSNTRFDSDPSNGDKAVIVRVKRKPDQSPLQAFWLEINERPAKRPLIDFQKLSISAASTTKEESKIKRVLVQHVETVGSSKASIQFLQSFVQPNFDGESKFKASTKERRRNLQKENKHDQILSKAKQEQEDLAKSARFEQIWKRRTRDKEAFHNEALDEVCRVYDVLRVDESSKVVEKQDEISVEDQEMLSKFLPLLREYVPGAVEDIEADICSHASQQGSADGFVYDLYAVNEKIDEMENSYPFPLVQVDDDDQYYDGPGDSDYETDDSNEERESEEIVDDDTQEGIPQIPIDLFVKKNRKGVRFFDAFGNLRYKVGDASPLTPDNHGLRGRVLLDSSGNHLVSIYRSKDGTWKGFKGDGCEEMIFKAEQTLNTFSKIEFDITLSGQNGANFTYAMRGCVFWRTCTIYQDKFLVAQTNLMYKLGFRKHFVGRSKFRVTVFPGYSDYNLIASLILVFLEGRNS